MLLEHMETENGDREGKKQSKMEEAKALFDLFMDIHSVRGVTCYRKNTYSISSTVPRSLKAVTLHTLESAPETHNLNFKR